MPLPIHKSSFLATALYGDPEVMNFGLPAGPGRIVRVSQGDGIQQEDAGLRLSVVIIGFSAWLVKGPGTEVSETQLGVENTGWCRMKGRQKGRGGICGELGSFPWLWDRGTSLEGKMRATEPRLLLSPYHSISLLRAPSRWDILTAFPGPMFLTTDYGTLGGQQEVDRRPPA